MFSVSEFSVHVAAGCNTRYVSAVGLARCENRLRIRVRDSASRVSIENIGNRYVCARWAATKTTNQDPIIAVVHLDKRAAPKESCAPRRGVVLEFIHSHAVDRRMFTSRRDFQRLGWYLLIYRARHVIRSRECMARMYIRRVCLYIHAPIRNPKLQETVRLRLSKSWVKDIFHGMKDEKGTKRMVHKFGKALGKARRFSVARVMYMHTKLYSNLCRGAIDLLRLSVKNLKICSVKSMRIPFGKD